MMHGIGVGLAFYMVRLSVLMVYLTIHLTAMAVRLDVQ